MTHCMATRVDHLRIERSSSKYIGTVVILCYQKPLHSVWCSERKAIEGVKVGRERVGERERDREG